MLFVVPDGSIDIEYRITRRVLDEVGTRGTVVSWSTDALVGASGETLQPEVQLGKVHAGDFDAIVFLGGDHVKPTDPETQCLAEQAAAEDKVLAATCAGQGILKEASLWEGGRGGVTVERRDRIIVASGAIKAPEFAESVAAAMPE